MKLDWDDIQIFQKVGELGSFSKAAQALDISQPTVSRRMYHFQETLGVSLFERSEKGLVLSEKGQVLFDMAFDMTRNADAFQLAAQSLMQKSQTVRVACSPLVGLALSDNLDEVIAGLPGVHIALLTSVNFVNLEKGEADIALRNQRPDKGNLRVQSLGENHFGIYGTSELKKRFHREIMQENWQACPWVGYHSSMSQMPSRRWLAKNLGVTSPNLQVDHSLLILNAARRGKGFAILPTFTGEMEGLESLQRPLPDLVFENWLVSHEQTTHNSAISQVKQRLHKKLKRIFAL